jgi:Protein-tyrosine-phosphatase
MAEFVLKDMVRRRGLEKEFIIASAATSTEEIGNPVHPGTRNKLKEHGITTEGKRAVQLSKADYNKYDYFIGMDHWNVRNMKSMLSSDPQNKVRLLLDFTEESKDIADPWYTGNFDQTYVDVVRGCEALLNVVINSKV